MSYGAQLKFGIARQVSVGSGAAVGSATQAGSFHHIPLISENVGLTKDEVISGNLTGRFEEGAVYDGVSKIDGPIEFEVTPKALGAILALTLGNPTSASVVVSGSLRTFAFLPRSQDYSALFCNEPFTIYKQWSDANSGEWYYDCQMGQLDISFAQGALMRATAQVVGGSRVATGVGSIGIPLDTADLSLGFLWDATSISWGGNGVGNKSQITVSINEAIAPLYSLNGTLAPYKFTREGFRQVTVNGTMFFDTRSEYNDFISGTQRRLVLTSQARKTQIQSGYYAQLEIDIPQLKITQFKPGTQGPGEVSVQFTGRGVVDPSSAYAIKATLTNTYTPQY